MCVTVWINFSLYILRFVFKVTFIPIFPVLR